MASPSSPPSPPADTSDSTPSFLDPSPIPSSPSTIDSLPDSAPSDTISEASTSDAEREWKESLEQLELLLTMVVVPYAGKYFGRKCAYWGWAKFMEWKYPVTIEITSPGSFKAAGAVEAAATL
ncbi:MAG: hypothetical protein HETSPECPRED_007487 [Heterodermia speciosa]|uniref:Uncharacterized protein n=1 Tax=Heterodermia speciosa TaxID=116794 RepID=A0A8H3FPM9_9LECA|nr:MAG: hypothetical protein HETSPECPRED_007487 [Heterodermia speciosa]